jgi:hypothetical protein
LELRQDAGDVLPAPPAEAGQVGVGHHRRERGAVGGEVVEARRDQLQQPLGHAALEVKEQEVLDEGFVGMDLPGQVQQESPGGLEVLPQERQEALALDQPNGALLQGEGGGRSSLLAQDAELTEN